MHHKLISALLMMLCIVSLARAQEDETAAGGSPGWAAAVEEDLKLAATMDVSQPPKTCRPDIINSIDWGVATAAYQASLVMPSGMNEQQHQQLSSSLLGAQQPTFRFVLKTARNVLYHTNHKPLCAD